VCAHVVCALYEALLHCLVSGVVALPRRRRTEEKEEVRMGQALAISLFSSYLFALLLLWVVESKEEWVKEVA